MAMKIMAVKLLGAAVLLLALAPYFEAQSPQPSAEAAPKAFVPYTAYGFGNIYRDEVVSFPFIIRNDGNATLEIKEFTAG